MDRSLVESIYNALLSDLRSLDKSEPFDVFVAALAGGALGYVAFSGWAGAALCAFFAWLIRGIPYNIKRRLIVWELRRHALEFPDELDGSLIRDKIHAAVEKASRRFPL
jgi:hypothetical protein